MHHSLFAQVHIFLLSQPSDSQALDKDLNFWLLPFFLLNSSLFSKPNPPCFLLGTIASTLKELLLLVLQPEPRHASGVCNAALGACMTIAVSTLLVVSSSFGGLRINAFLASSSATMRSRREERLLSFLSLLDIGAASILSKIAASLGEASALSCFPRFMMVSWHSANFAEAVVISQP